MTVRIGINGFGRMGRLGLRAGIGFPELAWTRINDLSCDAATAAHLLQFDSVQGKWDQQVSASNDQVLVNGQRLSATAIDRVEDGHWGDCDIVLEATGVHHKHPQRLQQYLDQGVRAVVVAAPVPDVPNIVLGVNQNQFDPARHQIVCAASCTTNCLAPVVQVLQQHLGIRHGSMTTIHSLTNTQTIVDRGHKDLRRARAAGSSLIPTSTGSARAIGRIFPELEGRLNGHAVRVPLLTASLTDAVFEVAKTVTAEQVNNLFRAAADGPLRGILRVEEQPLVSVDFVGEPCSAVIDARSTLVVAGTQVKVYAWYDNEWGYANRLAELMQLVARAL